MKQALVPLAPGFEEIEACAVVDILRRAKGIEVTTASIGDKLVGGAHGIAVQADRTIDDVEKETFDLIALPGGMPGSTNLGDSPTLAGMLKRQAKEGRLLAAICAAPTVLEKHGLLSGRQATCHFSQKTKMVSCNLVEQRVVRDGSILTSQGPGTAIEFGLALVEVLVGKEEAERLSKAMLNGMGLREV